MDKEVTQKLALEAYDRMKKDVRASHILIAVSEDASEKEVKKAYDKAMMVKAELGKGGPFGKSAVKYTDHKPSRLKGGDLGFMTAILPKGFYALETYLYEGELEKISDPIRTKLGYHVVKVVERRAARGKMDLAHILIRKKDSHDHGEKAKIDTAYARLLRGMAFETVAAMLSQDKQSSKKGGFIGSYGIGLLEPVFEDAAFALQTDGAFSEPFQSSVGWHIVKRIKRNGGESFTLLKDQILKSLAQTERQGMAKQALIENVKVETEYKLNEPVLAAFIKDQTSEFFTYKWKPTGTNGTDVLFEMKGDYPKTINDFEAFIVRAGRARMRMGTQMNIDKGVREIYDLFIEEIALKYEEKNLLVKYSDFRNLMREYEEGILLFEVTDQEVWSKASKDSTGLKEFFKTVDGKFRWADKAVVNQYTVNTADPKLLKKVQKWAPKKGAEITIAKMKKKGVEVSVESIEVEKGKNPMIDKMPWTPNSTSSILTKESVSTFNVIQKTIPGRAKTLRESRGYVIADYQDYLEQKWIIELKQRFAYKLNEDVLKSLTKS